MPYKDIKAALLARQAAGDICSEPGCPKPRRTKGLCITHYNRSRDGGAPRPGDPDRVRQKNRMKTSRRHARMRDPDAEKIYIVRVGERDGWRCGICRRKVDQRRKWPHPRSPSLDHVIPLSEGGLHTYANVRIAHLDCNIRRQAGGGNEQLALIG